MLRRQVLVALAIVCVAIALRLALGRQPGTAASVPQEPHRIIPGRSPPAGVAPEPIPVPVAASVVQAPATTVSPSAVLGGPSPAVRVVAATAMPAVAHGAAPTRAAPEAERCLATALVGHPLFIPRSATPAAEFQHVLILQLPA